MKAKKYDSMPDYYHAESTKVFKDRKAEEAGRQSALDKGLSDFDIVKLETKAMGEGFEAAKKIALAEKQEQVRELDNRIEKQLNALENNLTGKISDKYLKGAIDAYNDLKIQLPQIFPDCAEQKKMV